MRSGLFWVGKKQLNVVQADLKLVAALESPLCLPLATSTHSCPMGWTSSPSAGSQSTLGICLYLQAPPWIITHSSPAFSTKDHRTGAWSFQPMAGAPTNTQHSVWHLGELIDTCYCTGNSFSSEVEHGEGRAERIVAYFILNVPVITQSSFSTIQSPHALHRLSPHSGFFYMKAPVPSSSVLTHQHCAAAESSN